MPHDVRAVLVRAGHYGMRGTAGCPPVSTSIACTVGGRTGGKLQANLRNCCLNNALQEIDGGGSAPGYKRSLAGFRAASMVSRGDARARAKSSVGEQSGAKLAVLPHAVKHWSLTTLRDRLVKIGVRIVRHGRSIAFQMAEVMAPRGLFRQILHAIAALRPSRPPARC